MASEPHVAIVTGASRGIGNAISRRLASAGVKVVATARSMRPGDGQYKGSLEETVAEIRADGGDAVAIIADLADPAYDRAGLLQGAESAFRAPVDIIVNNAAGARHFEMTYETMTAEMFRATLEVNVWSGWDLALKAIPGMKRRGAGWILNISSRGAAPRTGPPFRQTPLIFGQCLYGGTKAMIDRVTTGAASELYAENIAVNALAPESAVATENAVRVANPGAASSEPLETVAEAALALCSGDPKVLTGRVAYSLSLLIELGRPVRSLDGSALLSGWQPNEIDRARLARPYLAMEAAG